MLIFVKIIKWIAWPHDVENSTVVKTSYVKAKLKLYWYFNEIDYEV